VTFRLAFPTFLRCFPMTQTAINRGKRKPIRVAPGSA